MFIGAAGLDVRGYRQVRHALGAASRDHHRCGEEKAWRIVDPEVLSPG
jgi:hypothetical protein